MNNDRLVRYKTAAWQASADVESYVDRMRAPSGSQRLKNDIEIDLVRQWTAGRTVLDVGIGTGRVSVPLAGSDVQVTGLDASAAMLDHYRRAANDSSVELVEGDLAALPFKGATFDTVLSIDTFAHFPTWKTNLDELLRVTRPGGRVIVDVGSTDHVVAVAASRGSSSDEVCIDELATYDSFALRLSVGQLLRFAKKRRIELRAIVPYAVLCGSVAPNYWLTGPAGFSIAALDRLLSWFAVDEQLFRFASFIERRIAALLSPSACGRLFVVLEHTRGMNLQTAAQLRFERFDALAGAGELQLSDIVLGGEPDVEAWNAELLAHVEYEPNRVLAAVILQVVDPVGRFGRAISALPAVLSAEIARARRCARTDVEIDAEVTTFFAAAAQVLTFRGVDLRDVLRPNIVSEILAARPAV